MNIIKPVVSAEVAKASLAIQQHRLDWLLVDTLSGGTTTMRAAGQLFLPKEPKEAEADYLNRVKRSTLDNYYKDAIKMAVAKVLSKDIVLEKAPPEIMILSEDVDSQQRNLTQFSKEVFTDAVNHGISYILVDYPKLPQDMPFENRAQELAAGGRPYWVNVSSSRVLEARSARIQGSERLCLFRYVEVISELGEDGIGEITITQVREYSQLPDKVTGSVPQVRWRTYRQDDSNKEKYIVYEEGFLSVNAIPVAPVYTNKTSFYLGRPPMMELAELNAAHWAQSSDLTNIIHIVTVPFLMSKGLVEMDANGKPKTMEINIHSMINTMNKDADIKWIEHGGAAVNSAQEHLDRLVDRMNQLSSQLSTQASTSTTATQSAINAAEANSDLKSMALGLQDGINAALYFTAQLLGLQEYGRAVVNTSFSVDYVAVDTFDQVKALYDSGVIDWATVISEAKRRNIIDSTIKLVEPTKPEPVIAATPVVTDPNSLNSGTK